MSGLFYRYMEAFVAVNTFKVQMLQLKNLFVLYVARKNMLIAVND